ncbi:MAG TPA: SDR family oxidoreductase [Verrucomicrobiae bacterium]|nr:SDR family oxidoreductase [Verrucomicrobiae bacterium]
MRKPGAILLTGFTGVLGKRYAYRLAALGNQVVCPIRAGSEAEARSRFEAVFHTMREFTSDFDESVSSRIHPIPGDVREKALGMPLAWREKLKGTETASIWHLAALLDLTESNSQDVYDTNFLGTINVLEFARQQRIGELHYFSTFGSSGKLQDGVVREIPGIRPPSFRNTYERSKWEVERHLWQAQIRGEMAVSIYRPSIVVGDSLFGRYEQFNVFNHPFDVVSQVRARLCRKQGLDPKKDTLRFELRIPGDPRATLNIVPLDFVIDTALKIYATPGSVGRVYHIVNPHPPSLALTEQIFKQNEPWEGLGWAKFETGEGFRNTYEKFVARQIEFLTPYMLGEAVYDYSNVEAILALHGGIPPCRNEVFLDAICKRAVRHGWQEAKAAATIIPPEGPRERLDSGFVWPEGTGLVVDFSPRHPAGGETAPPVPHYTLVERVMAKIYRVEHRLLPRKSAAHPAVDGPVRDLVVMPFGVGITRRGEAEAYAYRHEEKLASEVLARMNQVVGFDLRDFALHEIPGHERAGHLHDHCCWAVADDLVHLARMFRDIQAVGGREWISRLQILPHSAGTYVAGWLAGVVSFEDMALITHQCSHLMAEAERLATLDELNRWFFAPDGRLSAEEMALLKQLRQKADAASALDRAKLADRLGGRLELLFSFSAHAMEKLVADLEKQRIGVSRAISMSPHGAVFAGNALEMARFDALFVGARKLEFKRVLVEVNGTPHCSRLKTAAEKITELLCRYLQQGRLRDPVVPFVSHHGEWVKTREQFVEAIAGIADQPMSYDRMVERSLERGGRHFFLMQSGMAATAADLFAGTVEDCASLLKYPSVRVYPANLRSREPHPICALLPKVAGRTTIAGQSFTNILHWHEQQLFPVNAPQTEPG